MTQSLTRGQRAGKMGFVETTATPTPRIRVLLNSGKQPEIRTALETPNGIVFVDTLGKRHPAATVIDYWTIEAKETTDA